MFSEINGDAVAALREERLDWRFKAIPAAAHGLTAGEYAATRPSLEEFGTPLLTLDAGALDHNLAAMAGWADAAGVRLAPHGKTTMAPALWRRQLHAGAWGITLANLPQLRVARAFGVRRLLLANELIDPAGLAWVSAELDRDPDFEFISWVDSARAVELMDTGLRTAGAQRPVDVCVELGGSPGRTGVRDDDEAVAIAEAIRRAPSLRLTGLGGYEGALAHDASAGGLATVETYLRRLARLHTRMPYETAEPIVTAGGSAYFDQVADLLGGLDATLVLRSGSYLVHDDGFYREISPFARTDQEDHAGRGDRADPGDGTDHTGRGGRGGTEGSSARTPLRPAMHGWARVVSRPEPDLALLDAGKRDLSFDLGFPEPQRVRGGGRLSGARITALNDQHAFLKGGDVQVGDVVRLGLSHPCTALDKWTLIPVVDDADAERPVVVDLIRTWF